MADWVIERLRASHDRTRFACGKAPLDVFLRTLVTQYEKRHLGRTFVASDPGQARVAGYYTLAAGSIGVTRLSESVRKKLPRHPIPTIHLGRLAVDQEYQGRNLGKVLFFHALRQALEVSERLGAFALDVLALDDGARAFYLHYGPLPLEDDPLHLYLPMATIEKLFNP